jgi:uncharacterized glyoxalase superfamily protein PhnB
MTKIFPCLAYRDAAAALDFLRRAFGLEEVEVDRAADGTIGHAVVGAGGDAIMLGQRAAKDVHRADPGIYIHVSELDAHLARAVAAGARIVRPLYDTPYGSREYSAEDPEGNCWHFGTYLPGRR